MEIVYTQAGLNEWNGIRYYRYRDLTQSIYGRPGFWATLVMQQIASIGNNISESIPLLDNSPIMFLANNNWCLQSAKRWQAAIQY